VSQIQLFINDPLIAPIYAVLVLSGIDFLLAIWRSAQAKVFDITKLPQILDSLVLQKVIPLAALGAASFFVTDTAAKTGLNAAYLALAATVLAAEVASMISKVTGSYTPTTLEQDQ
jgi:hypothetical protein